MSRGTVRLSGTQVQKLHDEVSFYALDNNINLTDVVVSLVLQSGRILLTDCGWDERERLGEHTDSTPQPRTLSGIYWDVVG